MGNMGSYWMTKETTFPTGWCRDNPQTCMGLTHRKHPALSQGIADSFSTFEKKRR